MNLLHLYLIKFLLYLYYYFNILNLILLNHHQLNYVNIQFIMLLQFLHLHYNLI